MASLTRWTWVWVNSGSWWWTGRPGVLQFIGSQRVRHDWTTELWTDCLPACLPSVLGKRVDYKFRYNMPKNPVLNNHSFNFITALSTELYWKWKLPTGYMKPSILQVKSGSVQNWWFIGGKCVGCRTSTKLSGIVRELIHFTYLGTSLQT